MSKSRNSWWIGGIIGVFLGLFIVKEGPVTAILVGACNGILFGWIIGKVIDSSRKNRINVKESTSHRSSNSDTKMPNTNFYNQHSILREKYKVLIDSFLKNDTDPLWQYPNATIKSKDLNSITIESSYTFGIQHIKITDSLNEVVINWHVYLTVDLPAGTPNSGDLTWHFPSNGDQNKMLETIFRDMLTLHENTGFQAFL